MDKLWGTFVLAPDGLYTWSRFCQRYISDMDKLKQASESEAQREESALISAAELQASADIGTYENSLVKKLRLSFEFCTRAMDILLYC